LPLCKQGDTKVDYCATCSLADNTVCYDCSLGRLLSADKKSCDCPADTESGNDGTCIDPLCKKGDTLVVDCAVCSGSDPTRCSTCDKGMIPVEGGTRCECGSGYELIDGTCARPNCMKGSTAVRGCTRCGYVATQCIECENGYAPVDNKCSGSNLSGGAIAGIVIAVVVIVAAIVVAVVIVLLRKKGAGSSRSKYVTMQGGDATATASVV